MTLHAAAVPGPGASGSMLVHGGAWDIPDEVCAAHCDGLRAALAAGRRLLEEEAPALAVVTEAVAVMEGHGAFEPALAAY